VLGSTLYRVSLNPAHVWHICGIWETATSTKCR
jgi:hypothetical protein